MAQTMRVTSSTQMKGARTMAPQRPAMGAVVGRVARVQHRQMSQACVAPVARAQQMQRNTHVVCVAAQEAPAQQETATQVRTPQTHPRYCGGINELIDHLL
jgi:predicted amidohydrolase